MKSIPASVKGTRDFYPEQMAMRRWLYDAMRATSERFGYREFDGPFVEPLELYAAKSGEELVKEQAFVFNDRSGERVALRPELTPSLARMVAQRQGRLARPIRWWSFGPFWRYERPQKGRAREFFQWNVDLLGVEAPEADAEVAALAADFFRSVGLTPNEVVVQVNNRRLMESELRQLGFEPDGIRPAFRLIDRRDKMEPLAWQAYAGTLGVSPDQLGGLERLLADAELWRKSDECVAFFAGVDALGIKAYVEFDPSVVRGLDYYTGMVFEARDRQAEFRAILGGGHYDNLVADVGGEPLPGVGFGMGDIIIGLVLQKFGRLPVPPTVTAQVLVTVFDRSSIHDDMRLASELRQAGLQAEWYPGIAKLQKQLKYADQTGIRFVAIQGPDERQAGEVTVKDLKTGTQERWPRAELGNQLLRRLG